MTPEPNQFLAEFKSISSISSGNMWAIITQFVNHKLAVQEHQMNELRTTLFKIQNELENVKEEKK